MMKKAILSAVFLFACLALEAEEPYWWANPHRDDAEAMYEKGVAADAASEQEAERKAVLAAKELLVERIGIAAALKDAGLASAPEFAIVNFEVASRDSELDRKSKTWTAWALIRYPTAEKQKVLERWRASLAMIEELKKQEAKIPVQFGLTLATADGRAQYREGEAVAFVVKADVDCHLILLDHQSDGTSVLLFPNRYNPEGFIRKGQRLRIPSPDDSNFLLMVGPPYGDDRIEAIAATKKSVLHAKFSGLVSELPESQPVAAMTRGVFVQGLGSAIGASSFEMKWSRAEFNLSTFSR